MSKSVCWCSCAAYSGIIGCKAVQVPYCIANFVMWPHGEFIRSRVLAWCSFMVSVLALTLLVLALTLLVLALTLLVLALLVVLVLPLLVLTLLVSALGR